MRFAAFFFLIAGTAAGGEYALLANGSRLHADRHESEAGKLRLFMGGGFIELDAAQVQGFEFEEPAACPAGDGPVPCRRSRRSVHSARTGGSRRR